MTTLRGLLTRFGSRCRLWPLLVLAIWNHAGVAFAQRAIKAAPVEQKSYILPYMAVILCIALGLIVVCRSGGRTNEARLEKLDEE